MIWLEVPDMPTATRVRDSQRLRIYRAHWALYEQSTARPSVAECQVFVDRVTTSDWWRNTYPRLTKVVVADGRRRSTAAAFTIERKIAVPKSGRYDLTLLHELAHLITKRTCADHGPEYARHLLDLVDRFISPAFGRRLREQFRANKVRVKRYSALETKIADLEREASRLHRAYTTIMGEIAVLKKELK
jgi:putative metallohydrolase (TIGR04338 family)